MKKIVSSIIHNKWNWNLILTFMGVVAAWIPFLYDHLLPTNIKGKILSQYDNQGTFIKRPASLWVFKLSVISINKSFTVKDIDVDIEYQNYGWTHNSSMSQRNTYFTMDNKLSRLTVPQQDFLNNLTILKKDEPVVGYVTVTTPLIKEKIIAIKFIFNSFENERKILAFDEKNLDSTKLFYDDSIWVPVDPLKKNELEKQFSLPAQASTPE